MLKLITKALYHNDICNAETELIRFININMGFVF